MLSSPVNSSSAPSTVHDIGFAKPTRDEKKSFKNIVNFADAMRNMADGLGHVFEQWVAWQDVAYTDWDQRLDPRIRAEFVSKPKLRGLGKFVTDLLKHLADFESEPDWQPKREIRERFFPAKKPASRRVQALRYIIEQFPRLPDDARRLIKQARTLEKCGLPLNEATGFCALHDAARSGDLAALRTLILKHGATLLGYRSYGRGEWTEDEECQWHQEEPPRTPIECAQESSHETLPGKLERIHAEAGELSKEEYETGLRFLVARELGGDSGIDRARSSQAAPDFETMDMTRLCSRPTDTELESISVCLQGRSFFDSTMRSGRSSGGLSMSDFSRAAEFGVNHKSRVRLLKRGLDERLITAVCRKGAAMSLPNGFSKHEYDGVTVIVDADGNFQVGYVSMETYRRGNACYIDLLENLYRALDGEDRLAIVRETLGVLCEAGAPEDHDVGVGIFQGLDLQRDPPDRPLLAHCCEHGYDECVRFLIQSAHFNPGVPARRSCSVLHLAAWGAQVEVVGLLEELGMAQKLVDLPNDFGEIPETTAWKCCCKAAAMEAGGAAEEGGAQRRKRDRWLEIATRCRNMRLNVKDSSEVAFVEHATELLLSAQSSASLTVPPGARVDAVTSYLRRHAESGTLQPKRLRINYQPHIGPHLQNIVFAALRSNHHLEELNLDCCGLGPKHMADLAVFLRERTGQQLSELSLVENPLGDAGVQVLFEEGGSALLGVTKVQLTNVGLTTLGLRHISNSILAAAGSAQTPTRNSLPLSLLGLDRNDLSQVHSEDGKTAMEEFIRALCKLPNLTHLFLERCRLAPDDILELVRAIPRGIKQLQVLDIYGSEIEPNSELSRLMPQVAANPSVALTRFNFDRVKFHDTWQKVHHAVCGRKKESQIKKRFSQDAATNDRRMRMGRGNDQRRGSRQPRGCPLQDPLGAVHYIKLTSQTHRGRIDCRLDVADAEEGCPKARLLTPWGSLLAYDPDGDLEGFSAGEDLEFRLAYSQDHRGLKLDGARRPLPGTLEASKPPPLCLSRVCVLLWRPAINSIFMLQCGRSPACRVLMSRLQLGVYPASFDLAERFPGAVFSRGAAGIKRITRRLTLEELLDGVDCTALTDFEVGIFANVESPANFGALNGEGDSRSESSAARLDRIRRTPVCQQLQEHFQKEKKSREHDPGRRTGISTRQSDGFLPMFPLETVRCEQSPGEREDRWLWPPANRAALDRALEGAYSRSVCVLGEASSLFVDVPDRRQATFHRLLVVRVEEDMVERVPVGDRTVATAQVRERRCVMVTEILSSGCIQHSTSVVHLHGEISSSGSAQDISLTREGTIVEWTAWPHVWYWYS